tara:strand:- start:28 stop:549 length:522 start_codon:yes stop_codon:yes gene_type:complete
MDNIDINNIDMIVEISENTNVKYEIDKQYNKLRCDRILLGPLVYPGNYGYIPNTLSLDNDPLDILLINSVKLLPNIIVKVKVLGVLITEDENGLDEKIIAIPDDSVYPFNNGINNITDLDIHLLEKIKYFFTHYKDMDDNKWVKVDNFKNKDEAIKILIQSNERYIRNKSSKL